MAGRGRILRSGQQIVELLAHAIDVSGRAGLAQAACFAQFVRAV
jgi:hypothetical protein